MPHGSNEVLSCEYSAPKVEAKRPSIPKPKRDTGRVCTIMHAEGALKRRIDCGWGQNACDSIFESETVVRLAQLPNQTTGQTDKILVVAVALDKAITGTTEQMHATMVIGPILEDLLQTCAPLDNAHHLLMSTEPWQTATTRVRAKQ